MSTKCMYIPDELIVEFLKRLPAKSLLRFMSVSKSWYSIIKNPNFISYHFNYQRNQKLKYLLYQRYDEYYVHADTDSFDRHLEIDFPKTSYELGCYNGILCCVNFIDNSLFLWNISLRKSFDINAPHHIRNDAEKMTHWFGFDEVSNDYKLVWVRCSAIESGTKRVFVVYIYSLNERTWRFANSSFVMDSGCLTGDGVYLNGVIHWVAERFRGDRYMPESILGFSLVNETFSCLYSLPSEIVYVELDVDHLADKDYLPPVDWVFLITVKRGCKDCLAAIHEDLTDLNFWVMEEEGIEESWRKDFSISKGNVKRILYARTNGEIVMQQKSGGVVSFDHRLMRMNILTSEYLNYVGTYMESLVLL